MTFLALVGFICIIFCAEIIVDKKPQYTSVYQILAPIAAFVITIIMFISDYSNVIPNGNYILSTEVRNIDKQQSYYYDIEVNVLRNENLRYCVNRIVKSNGQMEKIRNRDYADMGDPVQFIMPGNEDNPFSDYYEVKISKEDIPVTTMEKLKSFSLIEAILIIACLIVSIWAEIKIIKVKVIEDYM